MLVKYGQNSMQDLAFEASISNGGLNIPEVSGRGSHGNFNATLSVLPSRTGSAEVSVNLLARDLQY